MTWSLIVVSSQHKSSWSVLIQSLYTGVSTGDDVLEVVSVVGRNCVGGFAICKIYDFRSKALIAAKT